MAAKIFHRPMSKLALAASLIIVLAARFLSAVEPTAGEVEFFEQRIRPVLVEHCYACHSTEAKQQKKLKGGLLLDTRAGSRTGGETGPAVMPNDLGRSLLLTALRHQGGLEMPPSGKLPANVIADFTKWIETGAVDPREQAVENKVEINWDDAKRHWAFQLPVRHDPPVVQDRAWPQREIDHFILSALETKGLRPQPPAAKRTWLRRGTFALVGLPPTVEEFANFEQDASPQAKQTVIDRLLASPHYGERWGRHWLDVARYADDKALAFVNPWPHSHRYRDWVVRAFADDMPYDEILRLQLAGDLLPEPTTDYPRRLTGLGFQGLGAVYHKGNVGEQVKADEIDDRIDTLTRGLLGLTVACARCHDHKYDPIPTRDYYALAAAYNGANWDEVQLASPADIASYQAWDKAAKEKQTQATKWLEERGRELGRSAISQVERYLLLAWRMHVLQLKKVPFDDSALTKGEGLPAYFVNRCRKLLETAAAGKAPAPLAGWAAVIAEELKQPAVEETNVVVSDRLREATTKLMGEVTAALTPRAENEKPTAEQEALLKAILLDGNAPFFVGPKDVVELLSAEQKTEHAAQQTAIAEHAKLAPPQPPRAHGVTGGGTAMRIFIRGNVARPGEVAPPGFLQILRVGNDTPVTEGKFTRRDLAAAIASPANPLTARVIVNRVWQWHFGRGIVGTPSNFGLLGERPTHPELLDTLTVRFMEAGWSLKWLHREILASATYQSAADFDARSATVDPDNRLLWRFTPRRLDFEAWRDALLATSGRLDRSLGGPSANLAEATHVRRTLYSKISRLEPDKMLIAFDFPDANVSSEQRHTTVVPQQQLFVLNSEFMLANARAFAARSEQSSPDETERIVWSYQQAFGRPPTPDEQQTVRDFLQGTATSNNPLTPWQQFAHSLLAANEFAWVE